MVVKLFHAVVACLAMSGTLMSMMFATWAICKIWAMCRVTYTAKGLL